MADKANLIAMNNAVIGMRQFVRQARTCVVNKLVREAKTLRKKHGDEKQQQKYTRKADKLVQEVLALKKIKEDEVTLFGIGHTTGLRETLQDPTSTEVIRAMARLSDYKKLKDRLQEFREKFPDYADYVNSRRNSKSRSKKKVKKKVAKKEITKSSDKSLPDKTQTVSDNSIVADTPPRPNTPPIKIISKEATVKSFSEFLKTQHPELCEDKKDSCTETSTENSKPAIIEDGTAKKDNAFLASKEVSCEKTSTKNPEPVIVKENTSNQGDAFFVSKHNRCNDTSRGNLEPSTVKVDTGKENDDFFISKHGNTNTNTETCGWITRKDRKYESPRERKFDIQKQHRERHRNSDYFFGDKRRHNDNRISGQKIRTNGFEKRTENMPRSVRRQMEVGDASTKIENEKLHPSWEAKKKQRELMSSGFQGKKIVFDDD